MLYLLIAGALIGIGSIVKKAKGGILLLLIWLVTIAIWLLTSTIHLEFLVIALGTLWTVLVLVWIIVINRQKEGE